MFRKFMFGNIGEILSSLGVGVESKDGYTTKFGIVLSSRSPVEIELHKNLLAETALDGNATQQDLAADLQATFDIDKGDLDMLFMATADAEPVPLYETVLVAGTTTYESKARTYGICNILGVNRYGDTDSDQYIGPSLTPEIYAQDFLPKKFTDKLEHPSTLSPEEDAWYAAWKNSLDVRVVREPQHGKFIVSITEFGPEYEYAPEPKYIGKDRLDLLVSGNDKRGRPFTLTLRYFVNVLAEKEYPSQHDLALKKYCGNKYQWRISSADGGADSLRTELSQLGYNFDQANNISVTFSNLTNGAVGSTTGTTITLDNTSAGHNWFIDYTPYLNEAGAAWVERFLRNPGNSGRQVTNQRKR